VASNESFFLPGPAGRLEAILMQPEGEPDAAALVCHAHPAHGGIMHFKAVFRAAKALQQHRLAVLRFNFRGVGLSEGTHDQGRGEQDDVRAALDELQRRFPGRGVVLGGFSFGSQMALHVGVGDPRATALFALGFPLRHVDDTRFLDGCTKPRLFVQGEHDEFGSSEDLRALVERLPEPRRLVVIPGSDHFFNGHLDAMYDAVAGWADGRPWAQASG
jgi:alpha/beta superfamily hydrolase